MLNLTTLLSLTLIVVAGALFWQGQAIRELALTATRLRCRREQVTLLDQTVALTRRRLRWSNRFGPRMERRFSFEFTVTGGERYRGETDTLGGQVVRIALEAHRTPEPAPESHQQIH